jgi:hypothetical protein
VRKLLYAWVMVKLRRSSIEVRFGRPISYPGPACRLPPRPRLCSSTINCMCLYTTCNDLPYLKLSNILPNISHCT